MTSWKRTLGVLLLLAGCGSPEIESVPGTVPVSGTVTVDGEPLADGRILFIDAEHLPPRDYLAAIRNGKFELLAPPGLRRVEIRAYGESDPVTMEAPQLLPAQYNDASELSAELESDAPNVLSFELESK